MSEKVKGRAYSPSEKKIVVEMLLNVWLAFPGMRLGQLIDNAIPGTDLCYTEDDDLVKLLADYFEEHAK